MRHEDAVRLNHMRDAAEEALGYGQGMTLDQFRADTRTQRAVTYCIQVIGEAAYHIAQETRDEFPEVPWPKLVGTRHRLVHGYLEVDVEILWAVVDQHLEPLLEALHAVPRLDEDPPDPTTP